MSDWIIEFRDMDSHTIRKEAYCGQPLPAKGDFVYFDEPQKDYRVFLRHIFYDTRLISITLERVEHKRASNG